LKLDIACGQAKMDGHIGIDIADLPGVDIRHDLCSCPWPIEAGSVSAARCSHFFEHVPRFTRPSFMSEVWRILAPHARVVFQTPLGLHRQFQDFSHCWPVFPESYLYFNRDWLNRNGLSHYVELYGINCNFRVLDAIVGATDDFNGGTHEQRSFAAQNYVRGGSDLIVTLEKLPL
jgi:predicted SAM-dependent methyltransferase